MTPTDAQFDEITDKAFALGADPEEVTTLMEYLQNGPSREQREAQRHAEEQKAPEEAERKAREAAERQKKAEAERKRKEAEQKAERERIEAEKKRKEKEELAKKKDEEEKKRKQPSAKVMNIEAEYVSEKKKEGILVRFNLNTKNLKQQPFKITFISEEPMSCFGTPNSQEKDCKGGTDNDTIWYSFVHEGLSSREMTYVSFKLKIETIIDGKTILLVDPSKERHNINISRVKHFLFKDDVSIIGIH